ncbi:unnamed protein product [Ophioblennius macclurei]
MEDVHRQTHWLSFRGEIISFYCKRASVTEEDDNKKRETSELLFCRFAYDRENKSLAKRREGSYVISKKTSSAHVVKCTSAADQHGVTSACVLVTKKSLKRSSFQCSLFTLNASDRLMPCIDLQLPYQLKEEHVSIHQGPTVVWCHEDSVFYTSLHTGGVRQIPLQLSHSIIAELPLHKSQIFILGLQKSSDQSSDKQITSQTCGYTIEDGRVFDGTVVLPHPYMCITRCILVLSADCVDGVPSCAMVAATSNRQLVYFENAVVKDTCELPFEQPENIQVVDTGRNGCLYAISFQQGHVCAVWKETFQIASCWSGVSSIHVDDFLECGTDQMLLFFADQSNVGQPSEKFLITDLCGIAYSCGEDAEAQKAAAPAPENYLLTLQALESRLQSGVTVLQDLQEELRVKERVLRQTVRTLTDIVSDRETPVTHHEQEGLCALWESDDEPENEHSDDKMRDAPAAASSKPQIDKLWHRLAADRLVVGVTLNADSSKLVTSVSLSILTETGQNSTPAVIQTQSQVFHLPSSSSTSSSSSSTSSSFPEPAAKRSRHHSASRPNDLNARRLAVTASTELTPLLNSARVKCSVMLHYTRRRDALALAGNSTPAVLFCGRLDVDVRNEFQTQLLRTPELNTDEAREDLLSLMAVLDRWVFHIDSPEYSLGDINGWIREKAGCKKIEASPEYLLSNSSGPSAVMVLRWRQITPFQGELSVHSSKLQMLLFLDSLLAHLPASCGIQPANGVRGQAADRTFALALERELASLKEGVASTLGEERVDENAKEEETPETGSAEGLQRCREAWRRHVERSQRRLSPLVDAKRYRELVQSLSKAQLDADLAALLDNQTTPLA